MRSSLERLHAVQQRFHVLAISVNKGHGQN